MDIGIKYDSDAAGLGNGSRFQPGESREFGFTVKNDGDISVDIKPVITEGRDGTLQSVDKVRGRKKALNVLVDKLVEYEPDPAESPAIILHADAEEDARELKELALKKFPDLKIRIDNVGPVIGAHCGPGTLAITFLGKERKY